MKCEVCGKPNANAWFDNKHVCQRCWDAHKYGYWDVYVKNLNKNDMENN